MATTRIFVPCPGCGGDKSLRFFGLREDGTVDDVPPWQLEQHPHTYAGRGRITVAREDMPLNIALGLRAVLQARLAQLDEALAAAGVTG